MQGLGWIIAPPHCAVRLGAFLADGHYFARGGVAVGPDLIHTKAGAFFFYDPITDVNGRQWFFCWHLP